jgi:Ca-activated chloride channel family protein
MSMSMSRRGRWSWLVLVMALGGWEPFRSPNPQVERGNEAFRDGRWDDAIKAYDEAAKARPDDPAVRYNRGAAIYQKALNTPAGPARDQLLLEAEGELSRATQSNDPKLRSQAHYNLGNTQFQRQEWDKAISSYKKALKDDPDNKDARYNLELALRRKQKQHQHQQQQQGQQQQQQQQGQQGQQDQQQQQQGQQGQQDQQQQQQGQQQQQQGQQDQQQQQQQQQGQQDQQQGQQDQQQQDQQQQQQGQQDQQQQPQGQQDPQQGQPPQGQDGQQGQNQRDPGEDQDQDQPNRKPNQDMRPKYGDAEDKMDALERRSKDLKAQQQRGQGQRRRRGPVKDW